MRALSIVSIFTISMFALIGIFPAVHGETISVNAPITDVTVYPDRAVVTRSASTSVSEGITTLAISGLTESLLDDSLQVRIQADGELTVLDVRSAMGFSRPTGIERLQPLLDREAELEEEIAQTNIRLSLLQQERNFLAGIEKAATAPRTEGSLPSLQEWTELINFLREQHSNLLPRLREEEKQAEELGEELAAVQNEIAQTRGAERTVAKEALIRIAADAPVDSAEILLSYVVRNAGWRSQYNLRVASADRSIQLEYQAMVQQRTGEDWSNVSLSLSTARPALGGNPPTLGPWRVDVFKPRPISVERSVREELAPSPAASNRFQSKEMIVADMAEAAVEESLTSVNLRVPVPVSVPADGQPHRVGISRSSLSGEFYYTAVPKLSPHAYLQSRVTYEGEAPLLPGQTNILMDGNLIGRSQLERVDPQEKFEISLGVDEAIQIERQLVRRFVEQRGLISKSVRTRFEFLTTITNNRRTSETIVIKDHVPVSQHERIEVRVIEISGGEPEEGQSGHYRWELELEPGEKRELPLTFTVEHPEEMEITGL